MSWVYCVTYRHDDQRRKADRYDGDMSRRDEILGRHRDAIRRAAQRRKATSIALVGSVAQDTDDAASDVDFLCEWEDDADLVDIAGLWNDLRELLGCPVDVCSAEMLDGRYLSMRDHAIRI